MVLLKSYEIRLCSRIGQEIVIVENEIDSTLLHLWLVTTDDRYLSQFCWLEKIIIVNAMF